MVATGQKKSNLTTHGMVEKHSIVLLQGTLIDTFFDGLKKINPKEIFIMEGRPNLKSSQSSCRELLKRDLTPVLISDNMAGFLFFKNLVKEVWVASQLEDHDGALCEIGALILGVLGKRHKIPVYVFPSSKKTNFMGKEKDLMAFMNKMIAPKEIRAYVPLVEWLPQKYITQIKR